jgi:hypothetical protein
VPAVATTDQCQWTPKPVQDPLPAFSWPNFSPGRVSHSLWAVWSGWLLPLPFMIFGFSSWFIHSFVRSASLSFSAFSKRPPTSSFPHRSRRHSSGEKCPVPLIHRHNRSPLGAFPGPINVGKVKKKQSEERGRNRARETSPYPSCSFELLRPLTTTSARLRQLLSFWSPPCRFP